MALKANLLTLKINSTMDFCNTTLEQLPNNDWNLTFGILIALVSILAVAENGFIILLFYKYPKLRTPSNKILASVAVADWLTGLTVGPLYSAQLLSNELIHYCMVHTLRRAFGVIIMGSSLTSIAFMTIDRSRHLIELHRYSLDNKRLFGGIFLCWLLPLAAALLGLVSESVHSATVAIVGASIIIIIIACYALVIFALKRNRREMLNKKNAAYIKNEKKAMKTVIIIITCYFIMLLPLFVEKGLYSFNVLDEEDKSGLSQAHMFTILLYIANSNVNPIIYTSRLPAMRKYTMKLFGVEAKTSHSNESPLASSSQLLDKSVVYTKV